MQSDTSNNIEIKVVDPKQMNKKYIDNQKVKEQSNQIVVTSFPRSGNTMIRSILENATNIFTGDDIYYTEYDFELAGESLLGELGLGKESNIQNVFFVKTHYPLMKFDKHEFKAQAAIFIIRNPFDSILSYYHLLGNGHHSKKIKEDVLKSNEVQEEFTRFVKKYSEKYNFYQELYITHAFGKVPSYIIKYEDFIKDKANETKKLFDFLFKFKIDEEYLGGSKEDIIKKLETNMNDIIGYVAYKPDDCSFLKSLRNEAFTEEMIYEIVKNCYNVLKFFGYIEDLKNSKIEILIKAIEKYEKINQTESKYKYSNYTEIKEVNEKLINDFDKIEKQIDRPYITINDTTRTDIKCDYDDSNFYWQKYK